MDDVATTRKMIIGRFTVPRIISSIVVCASLAAACGNAITGPGDDISPGVWGGDSIRLTVTGTGAALEHGCDSGQIDGALTPDHSGRFSTDGTYSFGHGGPRQPGEPPAKIYTARYTGTVTGTTMRLSVFLPELARSIGDFTLQLGKPMLDRCL
jgi:predicted small secreted protein